MCYIAPSPSVGATPSFVVSLPLCSTFFHSRGKEEMKVKRANAKAIQKTSLRPAIYYASNTIPSSSVSPASAMVVRILQISYSLFRRVD